MSDISNNIIYPSHFNLNYEDKENTFFLESLTITKINNWKNSISTDISNNIVLNHKNFSKLLIELKSCLTSQSILVHKSFTNKPLILGNIFLYYCQYLSQCIFNNPFTIEPFSRNKEIKKSFFTFIDCFINSFYDKEYLDKFINNNFKDNSNNILFNIKPLSFKINIPSNNITFFDKSFIIPNTYWVITILLGNEL
tara:strand:- start:1781 stop:2368 length:588 start_codon:yes stop_codon:yes gene_type:complete